jgi:hypothetical protein
MSLTCFLLAVIAYPLMESIWSIFCLKDMYGHCKISGIGIFLGIATLIIMAALVVASLTFVIVGIIKKRKSKK